jgi:L-seryl-tRNA(Ser) seleniumtransferase
MTIAAQVGSERDRFGNAIDPHAGFARGPVLRGLEDELGRMLRGRELVRQRGLTLGVDSVYNLTGVTRAFPLESDDLTHLRTQLSFYCFFDGKAEELGVAYAGGDPAEHAACFASRVTSGMLATIMALAASSDVVLSVLPKGRAHPSIRNAVEAVGATLVEARGFDAALDALTTGRPAMLVITSITPQKFAFDEDELRELIAEGNRLGCKIVVDDAHTAVRVAHNGQAPVLRLGRIDVALCSLDKHLEGPRAGLLVGAKDSIARVNNMIYKFGLEAQFPSYAAGLRALEGYAVEPIAQAGALAKQLEIELADALTTDALYPAGPGVAIAEEDLMELVLAKAGEDSSPLVPAEVSSVVALRIVETAGLVTVVSIAMPGASASFRLLMYPDGGRAGIDAMCSASVEAVEFAAARHGDVDFIRRYICGDERS